MISVIIPTYNEGDLVTETANVITNVLKQRGIENELIFVDDGSKDDSWEQISKVSDVYNNVRGVHFSRNFGKEAAMAAGLKECKGDCCVIIDCDLQHPPEKIIEMYELWREGYDIIEGVKVARGKEGLLHKMSAGLFYKIISKLGGLDMQASSDFKLLDRRVIDIINAMPERNVFFRAMSHWVGFKSTTVTFEVQDRAGGDSKWSTKSLIKYAITNITSFSAAPMQIVTCLGTICLVLSVILSIETFINKIVGNALGGFSTVILLQLFIGSIIMISVGIIGYYIAKIYDEIKGRPKYIIDTFTENDIKNDRK